MESEPVQFLWRRYEEPLAEARSVLAKFLAAQSKDVVFVTNATTGVNAVVRSLQLKPGEELLTTNHDYNACRNALVVAARSRRAKVVVAQVPFPIRDAEQVIEAVVAAVTKRTRLAVLDHVSSHTALIFPIERLIRELQGRGIETLVDGAHAPGMAPVNLEKLGAAYYTGNLHKWICAPKGAGFLWARRDKQAELQPAVVSHGNNTPRPGYYPFQDRFDWAGTFDPTAWFCVGEAIRWLGRLLPGGWRELRQRNHQLAVAARRVLCDQLQVAAPCPENMLGAMATLPLPGQFQRKPKAGKIDAEQLELYDRFGIEVPLLRIGNPETRWFRISAQVYNSLAQYEYLGSALQRLNVSR